MGFRECIVKTIGRTIIQDENETIILVADLDMGIVRGPSVWSWQLFKKIGPRMQPIGEIHFIVLLTKNDIHPFVIREWVLGHPKLQAGYDKRITYLGAPQLGDPEPNGNGGNGDWLSIDPPTSSLNEIHVLTGELVAPGMKKFRIPEFDDRTEWKIEQPMIEDQFVRISEHGTHTGACMSMPIVAGQKIPFRITKLIEPDRVIVNAYINSHHLQVPISKSVLNTPPVDIDIGKGILDLLENTRHWYTDTSGVPFLYFNNVTKELQIGPKSAKYGQTVRLLRHNVDFQKNWINYITELEFQRIDDLWYLFRMFDDENRKLLKLHRDKIELFRVLGYHPTEPYMKSLGAFPINLGTDWHTLKTRSENNLHWISIDDKVVLKVTDPHESWTSRGGVGLELAEDKKAKIRGHWKVTPI